MGGDDFPFWLLPQQARLLSGRIPQEKNPPALTDAKVPVGGDA